MNLRHLRLFLVLAEELHFRRAAERLNMTQAPLSMAIQALETDLGARLFRRTRRSVELTEAGQAFLADARSILERVGDAREHVRRVVGGETGTLRVGFTSSSTLLPFFPGVIHAYRTKRPDVSVRLLEIPSALQLEAVANREIDIGVLRRAGDAAVPDVVVTRLLDEPLVVAMRDNHRLARKATVKIEELRNEPFVAYPSDAGLGIHETIMILCGRRSFSPIVVQEARQASTIVGLAASGLGIAIVPAALQTIQVPGIEFKTIADSDAVTELSLAHRFGDANPLAHEFREIALAFCRRTDGG